MIVVEKNVTIHLYMTCNMYNVYDFFVIPSDFGKNLTLLQFNGKHVVMRRGEGSIVATGVSPYPAILHSYVNQSRWDDAVRLCRFVKVRIHLFPSISSTPTRHVTSMNNFFQLTESP